ncbi:hypothetical protein ThrDRAFT_03165 [Frankia casuarinae]|uniref:Uncharacterized protein n=1 Tax=Frankia casuarinae (strain DSM 45818 / CECT 9043 / HFP020203 / CcI3) TaxID=106370 RepID=Q2JC30_FRACC|nr:MULTISPECIES: hypothetical protein [Frankia]ABD11162.1 hypothetical protein Francci3_1786 [Frankia casuarinae]ETA00814.1 hypothetical protein CcI6DRAFT_03755 [Frankia sp. CcI6]EYT91238.1 hypothetical protein ThrDRAFT_03165 [Frankia casuarinae]KFB03368.1 hypothetical protein ALLO2DRAFT_03872 [Frankia sp. Allo2]OAA21490.1 hypothetical protein AAY23_107629 [Frankia casuarinae]
MTVEGGRDNVGCRVDDDARTAALGALAEARERARSIETEIRTLAARAAAEGASYGDIGRALGITRQGARKRFPRLVDARQPATPRVVGEELEGTGSPAGRPSPEVSKPTASDSTTRVVEPAVRREGSAVARHSGGAEERLDLAPTEPAAPEIVSDQATTMVVISEEPPPSPFSDPQERAAAPSAAARPRTARSPRARTTPPLSEMDQALATAAGLTEDSEYILERTGSGYRVLVDGVLCGTLRPVYTGMVRNRPRGWLPQAPGHTSVFPPARHYPTRDEAVSHLLTDLRHQAAERRRARRRRAHR